MPLGELGDKLEALFKVTRLDAEQAVSEVVSFAKDQMQEIAEFKAAELTKIADEMEALREGKLRQLAQSITELQNAAKDGQVLHSILPTIQGLGPPAASQRSQHDSGYNPSSSATGWQQYPLQPAGFNYQQPSARAAPSILTKDDVRLPSHPDNPHPNTLGQQGYFSQPMDFNAKYDGAGASNEGGPSQFGMNKFVPTFLSNASIPLTGLVDLLNSEDLLGAFPAEE